MHKYDFKPYFFGSQVHISCAPVSAPVKSKPTFAMLLPKISCCETAYLPMQPSGAPGGHNLPLLEPNCFTLYPT